MSPPFSAAGLAMFFGHHLKPGSKLKVADACHRGAEVLLVTSACLAGDADRPATLKVHDPSGRTLSVCSLSPSTRRFARLDLRLDIGGTGGFVLEAVGAAIDLIGFAEPEPELDSKAPSKSAAAPAVAASPAPAAAPAPAAKKDPPAVQQQTKKPIQASGGAAAKTSGDSGAAQPRDFIPTKKFAGAKAGMVFKLGKQGLGYYKDTYVRPAAGDKRKADSAPAASAPPPSKKITLAGGLKYEVVKAASANANKARRGQRVQMKYDGRLAANGRRFDKGTIRFKLGAGEVIQGWDIGIDGMAVGEQRRLLIPSGMAYGRSGAPPDIPPNATLTFDVELLKIN